MSSILDSLQYKQIRKYHYEKNDNKLALEIINREIEILEILISQMNKYKIDLNMSFKHEDRIKLERLLIESEDLESSIKLFDNDSDGFEDDDYSDNEFGLKEMKSKLYFNENEINEILNNYRNL